MNAHGHRLSRTDSTPYDRTLIIALAATVAAIVVFAVLMLTGRDAHAAAPEPTAPPVEVCAELEPGLWMTTGPIPLPCGPTLAALNATTLPPIDPATGCTPAVPSTGCPGDQPAAPAPSPAGAVQTYCDDSSCTSTVPEDTTTTTSTTVAPSTSSTTSTTAAPTTTTTVAPSTTTHPPASSTSTTTSSVAVGPPPTQPCQEDEPCWDCATMGNHECGPTPQLPITGDDHRAVILASLVVGLTGVILVTVSRRRSAS